MSFGAKISILYSNPARFIYPRPTISRLSNWSPNIFKTFDDRKLQERRLRFFNFRQLAKGSSKSLGLVNEQWERLKEMRFGRAKPKALKLNPDNCRVFND